MSRCLILLGIHEVLCVVAPTTTTTYPGTTTTTMVTGNEYACTRLMGMSQTRQAYFGFMATAGVAQEEWEGQTEAPRFSGSGPTPTSGA